MSIYKRDCIVSTRTDIRLLAGFAKFYKKDVLARTKSSLVGDIIEDFACFLQKKELLQIPTTVVEAIDILKQSNFSFIGGRGRTEQRGVVKRLADEEYEDTAGEMDSIDPEMVERVAEDITGKKVQK